jgi:hypothetical protein
MLVGRLTFRTATLVLAGAISVMLVVEMFFPNSVLAFFSSYSKDYNLPPHALVGCGAQFAGSKAISQVMECVHKKYYTPMQDPVLNLGMTTVNTMVRNRRQYNLIYETKHYSDLLAFVPVLRDYRAVVVVRHPLERILSLSYHIKYNKEDTWLHNRLVFEVNSTDKGISMQEYINSLSPAEALLYGIYIASLFFDKEVTELKKIRSALAITPPTSSSSVGTIIRYENFQNNISGVFKEVSRVFGVDEQVTRDCAEKNLEFVSKGYKYSGVFECAHYEYFEKLLGLERTMTGFGYSDDLVDYKRHRNLACSADTDAGDTTKKLNYKWPTINKKVFNDIFTAYEFEFNKIERLSEWIGVRGALVDRIEKVGRLRAENHLVKLNYTSTKSSMFGSDGINSKIDEKQISPLEVEQILDMSQKAVSDCFANEGNLSKTYSQKPTLDYLTFIKRSDAYKSLPQKEKDLRISDSTRYPIDTPDGWIKQMCPEVIDYFRGQRVDYFDFHLDIGNPITTTEAAITMACLLKVIKVVALEIDMKWALFAGTQLGAVLHGGPIPWDDDLDVIIDGAKGGLFQKRIQNLTIGKYKWNCREKSIVHKVLRCFIENDSYLVIANNHRQWWPFIDFFYYYPGSDLTLEYFERRKLASKVWRADDFLPFRHAFYGGVMVPTVRVETAMLHYDLRGCYNGNPHRVDMHHTEFQRFWLNIVHKLTINYKKPESKLFDSKLNCCVLSEFFPFIHRVRSR